MEHSLPEMIFDPSRSINAECEATRNFIEILRREQSALKQAEVSMLLPLAQEKAHRPSNWLNCRKRANAGFSAGPCPRSLGR